MTDTQALIERLRHCSQNTKDEYLHELTGQAATALTEAEAKLVKAREENERLTKALRPEWFYLAGDMSSDRCRFSPSEVIDEDWLWDNRAEGSSVVQIECATPCPDIWVAVRFFTNEEKDERDLDDDYELTEHATEEAARACLAELENG